MDPERYAEQMRWRQNVLEKVSRLLMNEYL